MSITQISKVEARYGLQENLPQLSVGEFGWAVDTQQLYIGNGSIEEGAPFIGNTQILTALSGGGGNVTLIPYAGIPSGVQNGVNTTFTIPSIPMLNTLIVWQNFPLIPGVGYEQSGTTIVFTNAPISSDNLYYQYWVAS